MMNETPWWFPEKTDDKWIKKIRDEYPDETKEWSDEYVIEYYANGCRYSTLWDNLGDAYEQFEALADAYLELLK